MTRLTKAQIVAMHGSKIQGSARKSTTPSYSKPVTHSTVAKEAESDEDQVPLPRALKKRKASPKPAEDESKEKKKVQSRSHQTAESETDSSRFSEESQPGIAKRKD
jgi:hypothetical protein